MGIYSLFEIWWIWTGNSYCGQILITINRNLYTPEFAHGWWPPLLWKGQVRSFAPEPSFFGIYAAFIIPFLWYRIFYENRKLEFVLLIYFVFMVFMTKARTATVIYFGEVACLILISLWLRYDN